MRLGHQEHTSSHAAFPQFDFAGRLGASGSIALVLLLAAITHAARTGSVELILFPFIIVAIWLLLDAAEDLFHGSFDLRVRPIDGKFFPSISRLTTQGLLPNRIASNRTG